MSGEFLTQVLAAGQTMQFTKAGKYFEVIADGGSTFDFSFYGPNGALSANWRNCQSGMYVEDPYSAFDVKNNSAASQAITLLLMDNGRGGSRRQPGNVRVIDEITDAITSFGVNAPVTTTAATWVQVVAPAANLRGIIVRGASLSVQSGAGGNCDFGFVAAKSAPTSSTVPAQRYEMAYAYSASGTLLTPSDPHFNKALPPGWGLYYHFSVAAVAAAVVSGTIQYELQ